MRVENTSSVSEVELISALWCLLRELHEDGGCKRNEEQAGYDISIRDAASDCLSKDRVPTTFPFFEFECTRAHAHTQVRMFIHKEVRTHYESAISQC